MRILYHHRTLGDGAEGVHIQAIVDAFRALGHEVSVVGLAAGAAGGTRSRVIERIRALMPGVGFELASALSNVPDYVQTRRAIARFQPDLLYKRHSRYDVAALVAARRAGVPSVLEVNCVFTAPGYQRFEPLAFARLACAFERRALRLATLVTTVSTPLAVTVRRLAAVDALVTPNGADPLQFDPTSRDGRRVRQKHGLGHGLTAGWSGIIRDWHGLDLLLDAAAQVPDVTVLIVGDGPGRMALERQVRQRSMGDRVIVTGRVPHDEMPDYVAAMDIAVVADERTGVASPMKLLEYMAMARAVVAPRADNIRDLVEDGVDGLLFEPGHAGELASALRRLGGDQASRAAYGARARQKVERERNWGAIASRILSRCPGRDGQAPGTADRTPTGRSSLK